LSCLRAVRAPAEILLVTVSTASARTGTVPAAGTELAYLRIGEGAPLVVIPGGPRFGFAHVRPALDVLATSRELVYVDERGSGSSPAGDPASISTAGTLSDLDALLDELELEQVALAGHSLAAHMVALYAATRSDRVRALVLLNPAPPFAPEHREQFGKEMSSRRTPEDADEMERIKASSEYEAGDVAAVERYYQVLYVPFFNDRQVALSTQYGLTENRSKNRDTAQRLFADFGEHALPMKLGSIACPTLVIHGENDPVPVASSAAIADAIPQGQLVVIPGSSHYGFLESQETVAAAVETFLVAHAS
jgi:pimeloyl-ACP methyl ester carboxylesterase